MGRKVKIDKAIYEVDDRLKAYWFLRRNPLWKGLDERENKKNKKSINGYRRILRNAKSNANRFFVMP